MQGYQENVKKRYCIAIFRIIKYLNDHVLFLTELQRKQMELQKAAAAMKEVVSALRR